VLVPFSTPGGGWRRGARTDLGLIFDDIREELRGRPYELVAVAGGF
jgi:hypothetical protein